MRKTKAQLQFELADALEKLRQERESVKWWTQQAYKGIQDIAGVPESEQVKPLLDGYDEMLQSK